MTVFVFELGFGQAENLMVDRSATLETSSHQGKDIGQSGYASQQS
jgi:hypothetical protein